VGTLLLATHCRNSLPAALSTFWTIFCLPAAERLRGFALASCTVPNALVDPDLPKQGNRMVHCHSPTGAPPCRYDHASILVTRPICSHKVGSLPGACARGAGAARPNPSATSYPSARTTACLYEPVLPQRFPSIFISHLGCPTEHQRRRRMPGRKSPVRRFRPQRAGCLPPNGLTRRTDLTAIRHAAALVWQIRPQKPPRRAPIRIPAFSRT